MDGGRVRDTAPRPPRGCAANSCRPSSGSALSVPPREHSPAGLSGAPHTPNDHPSVRTHVPSLGTMPHMSVTSVSMKVTRPARAILEADGPRRGGAGGSAHPRGRKDLEHDSAGLENESPSWSRRCQPAWALHATPREPADGAAASGLSRCGPQSPPGHLEMSQGPVRMATGPHVGDCAQHPFHRGEDLEVAAAADLVAVR